MTRTVVVLALCGLALPDAARGAEAAEKLKATKTVGWVSDGHIAEGGQDRADPPTLTRIPGRWAATLPLLVGL